MRILNEIHAKFNNELETYGDLWRMLRRGTIVDLIKLSFQKYQNRHHISDLIEIVNLIMKAKILSEVRGINITESLSNTADSFNENNAKLLKLHEKILSSAISRYNSRTQAETS